MERVRRRSKWERERKGWYRGAAKNQIFEHVMWPLGLLAVGAAVGVAVAIEELPGRAGWLAVVGVLLALALAHGLLRARTWAWRIGGVLAALFALAHLVALITGRGGEALGVVLWAVIAAELLRASPRALAEQARTGEPPRELAGGAE